MLKTLLLSGSEGRVYHTYVRTAKAAFATAQVCLERLHYLILKTVQGLPLLQAVLCSYLVNPIDMDHLLATLGST